MRSLFGRKDSFFGEQNETTDFNHAGIAKCHEQQGQ